MKYIHTNDAPAAIGPYSQAIEANGFIFSAGQIGLDPNINDMVEGIEAQTHQVIKNIAAVLTKAESSLEHVVKTTIFLSDMKDYAVVNTIYGEYFSLHKPARSTIQVSELPRNALIEIEAIAVKV